MPAPPRARLRIGILTGSGPEAGIDLWQKMLEANRSLVGQTFRGDLDAPHVTIVSVPELGLSMELAKNRDVVWRHLEEAALAIDGLTDVYAIACNTLNHFQPELDTLGLRSRFVSFRDCVVRHMQVSGIERVCVLGARPIMELGAWSHYASLRDHVRVDLPSDAVIAAVHELIYAIKRDGAHAAGLRERLEEILGGIESDTVLLACTELPLVHGVTSDKRLLDVTQLVADELVRLSFQPGS